MRFFSLLPVLATLVTVVAGVTLPRDDGDCASSEMGCDVDVTPPAVKRDFSGSGPSNADLLRRGLSIKDPVVRRGPPPPPKASPAPPTNAQSGHIDVIDYHGIIAVKRRRDKTIIGYVSSKKLGTGQYRYGDKSCALIVDFHVPKKTPHDKFHLYTGNADSFFALVGLVQGRLNSGINLTPGSWEYTYLAGTFSTPAGSPALVVPNSYTFKTGLAAESFIWHFNPSTKFLLPNWVNADRKCAVTEVVVQNTGVYVVGDVKAFTTRFPSPSTEIVDLVFVPTPL